MNKTFMIMDLGRVQKPARFDRYIQSA